jgi:hypothetical protein
LSSPDQGQIARQQELEADVAQIRRDLDQIMAHLKLTNAPAAGP